MAEAVIGKRPYHAFLSHAHVNKTQADALYGFLAGVADIPVWYDAVDLPPGASFARGLYEAGAALSADVPVALLRQGPPGRPPFMLRDQQVYDYATDAELVGRAVRIAYPYRRFLQT